MTPEIAAPFYLLLLFLILSSLLHRPTFAFKKVSIYRLTPLFLGINIWYVPSIGVLFQFNLFSYLWCSHMWCTLGLIHMEKMSHLVIVIKWQSLIMTSWDHSWEGSEFYVHLWIGQIPIVFFLNQVECYWYAWTCFCRDKAKDAIFYSYTRHINGFAATLEDEEAAQIASKNFLQILMLFSG